MIRIYNTQDLDTSIKNQLDNFIEEEFGHIPIVKETAWAVPNHTIIFYQGDEIAGFYNIVERTITIDGKDYFAVGINNVITPPKYRGKGISSKTLRETEDFIFTELKAELGLLLCADNLLPFYNKLNWYRVQCPVYFEQPSGKKLWAANTMLRTPGRVLSPKEIDLNGLPW